MIEIDKPKLEQIAQGDTLKVLHVTGDVGMHMPEHHSTQEGAIMVRQGKALLTMKGDKYLLQQGEVFIIPASERHSLSVLEAFEAYVTMPIASSIEF